jgi:hypothetical protein
MTILRAKKWLGLALALTIAVNLLLPFFATYNDKAPPSGLASIFGEKVLICTSEGFVWVKLEDLLAGKTPVKPHKSYFCPLCYIADHAIGKIMLVAAAITFLHTKPETTLFLRQHLSLRPAYAFLYSRAPPFSFAG